jgi:hypothetical protein
MVWIDDRWCEVCNHDALKDDGEHTESFVMKIAGFLLKRKDFDTLSRMLQYDRDDYAEVDQHLSDWKFANEFFPLDHPRPYSVVQQVTETIHDSVDGGYSDLTDEIY